MLYTLWQIDVLISRKALSDMTHPHVHMKQNLNFPFISTPRTGQMNSADCWSSYASPLLADFWKDGLGVSTISFTSFIFLMCFAHSGAFDLSNNASSTDSLLKRSPNSQATIGALSGSCVEAQSRHLQ